MSIRYSPRSIADGNDLEQARRTLFPGDGSTLGSPPRMKLNKGSGGTNIDTNSVRFSKLMLVCTATLSVMAIQAAIQTWDKNMLVEPTTNMFLLQQSVPYNSVPADLQSPNRLIESLQNAPIGSLGPSGTTREHLRYYDTLFYTTLKYGANAKSIIEVGCASDPFLRHLEWIDQRTCVAPYFVEYEKESGKYIGLDSTTEIKKVTADFMDYQLPNDEKFDLLLCNQVLEHVPDPASFMKKLVASAKTSIISVPYNWSHCGKTCNHKTNYITIEKLKKWSAPHVPIYHKIVKEEGNGRGRKRVIVVFESS